MNRNYSRLILAAAAIWLIAPSAVAHPGAAPKSQHPKHNYTASGHAPVGVMGDHLHGDGEWMVSYRFMRMEMAGSRDGTDTLSADDIVTSVANRFFGVPMQPPTLRVVPAEMAMDMHMVGLMYGLTDRVTLTAMTSFVTKDMDHITFQGPVGTTELGSFTTKTSGFGDTTLGALIGVDRDGADRWHLNLAISLPTGSIDETGTILTPMNTRPTVRLPYAMQLGSGTFDIKPGITYLGRSGDWSWGAQALGTIRLDENDEGYALGDRIEGTAWLAYDLSRNLSVGTRVKADSQGRIDGIDQAIIGPVQTADPDNFGGETAELLFGANYLFTNGPFAKNRLAIEAGLPVHRDLNGPQLESDWTLTLGWQRAF
ncbi:MAG: alpha-amylase [Hyphomonas sp. BRH_c22]|uniref:transporter n=1 Tax=Hyphomonas sp. BRH_c22 TaxID=1629710 RepID=UPI0005F12CE6|nr:transporter [Hyphomonas sp. BRH_c22]KJS39422.1 MAG: alpha-amylase [Hyphomonas sp. BRH_c22]